MFCLQSAKAVVPGAEVEIPCPSAEHRGFFDIRAFDFLGGLLHVNVGVLSKTAGRGEEQTTMLGTLRQQTFNKFQAERDGLSGELRIVVRCEGGAAVGQRVAELIDGKLPNGAASECNRQDENESNARAGGIAVPAKTLPSSSAGGEPVTEQQPVQPVPSEFCDYNGVHQCCYDHNNGDMQTFVNHGLLLSLFAIHFSKRNPLCLCGEPTRFGNGAQATRNAKPPRSEDVAQCRCLVRLAS